MIYQTIFVLDHTPKERIPSGHPVLGVPDGSQGRVPPASITGLANKANPAWGPMANLRGSLYPASKTVQEMGIRSEMNLALIGIRFE